MSLEGGSQSPSASAVDFETLRERLLGAVRSVCPGWLHDDREDIVQQAMIRVIESARRRESNVPFSASYLWKVAYCATIDEIRRHRRRREVGWDDAVSEDLGPAAPESPEDDRALADLGRATQACLETLVDARRIVVGCHLLGFTVPEMTRSLGWGEKSVRNLLFRGMTDLRRCLEKKGISP